MKLALLIWSLVIGHCLAGPFFFGQQWAIEQGVVPPEPISGFDPADYGTVALWGGARYETSYANNDAVPSVADFSGNSRTASQGTSAAQPTFKAAGEVAGVSLPVLYFDGGYVLNTASFATLTQPYTLAFVAKSATTAANNSPFGSNEGSSYTGISARTSATWLAYANGAGFTGGTSTSWSVVVVVFNGSSSFMYVNGTKTTGDASTRSFVSGAAIGAWRSNYEKFNGHIGEWALWSEGLSDGEAAAACAALQSDWGL